MNNRKDGLLTTADLGQNRSQEPSLMEQVENLQSSCRVLERSIQLQYQVANEFPQGSKDYGTAIQIVASLEEAHAERMFEASSLRLQATFGGNKLQAAQVLSSWLDQVAAEVEARRSQPTPQQPADLPMMDSGTTIAAENGDGESLEAADGKPKPEDEEPVH